MTSNDVEHLTVKSTLHTHNMYIQHVHRNIQVLTPETQILVRFSLNPAVFQIKGCQIWKCTELPQAEFETLNGQNYFTYTK